MTPSSALPDEIAIRVRCPECGATLRAATEVVTCAYCGKESRVQRRTQLLQRPIDLPPLGPQQPRTVALQQRNTGRWLAVGVILASTVIGLITYAGATHLDPALAPRAVDREEVDGFWATRYPLLADVDGDGSEDAIGLVRRMRSRDGLYLRAISGRTGKTLWETPSLGVYDQNDRTLLALAPGVIFAADTEYKPRLAAYDARTGARRWAITPGEVVSDLCGDRGGHVVLVTKDEAAATVALATGALTPLPRAPACARLPNSEPRVVTLDTNNRHWGFAPPGMQSDGIVGDPSSWILIGYKSPGTAIPMLAVIDDREHVKWTTVVASTDPMSSKWPLNQLVAHDATLLATVYARKDDKQPPVLVAFDRARGTRIFETPLVRTGTWYSTGVAIEVGATAVWVAMDDGLRAFERTTGALRWPPAR